MFNKRMLFTIISIFFITSLQAESVARVIKSMGDVMVKPTGTEEFSTVVKPGLAINNGDHLRVGDTGFAVLIYLDDKSVLKVRENSEFQFVDTQNTRTVDMKYGTVYNQVAKENREKAFRVQTPTSVASVKGTEFWALVDLAGIDQFMGTEGLFEVLNQISGQIVQVAAGQTAISNSIGSLMNTPTLPGSVPQDPDPDTQVDGDSEETDDTETETESEDSSSETEETPDTTTETTPDTETTPEDIPTPDVDEEGPGEETPDAGRNFGMGMGIGSVTIDGKIYNQFALRPEFSFGKLGVGLDVVLYIDDQGNVRSEEWDEASDYIDKFLYLRWAEKSDPLWFKLGALNSVTIGYGGLVSGYSNMMEFPSVRRIGVNMGVNMGKIGTEILLANVKDLARGGTLAALRTSFTVSKKFPLTFGVNAVLDINQFSGMKDKDGDKYPDLFDEFPEEAKYWVDTDNDGLADNNPTDRDRDGDGLPDVPDEIGYDDVQTFWEELEAVTGGDFSQYYSVVPDTSADLDPDPFNIESNKAMAIGFGADIGYPIFANKFIALDVYTEFNHLIFPKVDPTVSFIGRDEKSGTGISIPGVRISILKFLNITAEYRIKQQYYVQNYFDASYDLTRVMPYYIGDDPYVATRDMVLFADEASSTNTAGYYGAASASILNIASFSASYANMKADDIEFNSFFAQASVNTEYIPKLSMASAYYQRNNDPNPFDFGNPSENTILGYKLGYEISKGVSLIWDFRQFYRNVGGEELEPVRMTTIETAFSF